MRQELEYKTIRFASDHDGISQRIQITNDMAAKGWRIVSEAIEQGQVKSAQACCLFTICMPLAFFAGRTPSIVSVTFARETPIDIAFSSAQEGASLETPMPSVRTSRDSISTTLQIIAVAAILATLGWMLTTISRRAERDNQVDDPERTTAAPQKPKSAVSGAGVPLGAKVHIDLPRLVLRRRMTVERRLGKPEVLQAVKFSTFPTVMAKYGWGDLHYQEGRLVGMEYHPKMPVASLEDALARIGLRATSTPEEHDLFFSWSTGPNSYRPTASFRPLDCCGLAYRIPWLSVTRDFATIYADFADLPWRSKWSREMQKAWALYDN